MTKNALLISADPNWAHASGLGSALGLLGFHVITLTENPLAFEAVEVVLVDYQRRKQETHHQIEEAARAGCRMFAVVCADAVVQERAASSGRFHGVLQFPVDECALARALTAHGYVAVSASERRSLRARLNELTCGDDALTQHFIRLLIDTNQASLATLRDAFAAPSWDRMAGAAHRIAGSIRLLGCAGLIALLVRLEAAARAQDAALARAMLAIVTESLDALDMSLEALLDTAASC